VFAQMLNQISLVHSIAHDKTDDSHSMVGKDGARSKKRQVFGDYTLTLVMMA
jgi:hypothetical protein